MEKIDFSKERILVTGGAGFVGSNIVNTLLNYGAYVVVLDDFFSGSEENLLMDMPNIEIVRGSVTDFELVKSVMKGCNIVIHEAARNIIVSTKNPREDCEVNILGTLNVLEAASQFKFIQRVVYSSSASIYGNPRYLPINEDDRINTLSPYSVSKLAGENYCRAFYETYGLSTAVVRYSNVFGINQRSSNPYCGVVGRFFESAMKGENLHVHGDGEQTRDYTYVSDAVEATLRAAYMPRAEGQIYNIGTGRETSVNKLAQLIIQITNSNSKIEHIDRRDIDNIRRRVLNIEKIRRELRWIPSITVEKGLTLTYNWIKKI